MKVLVATDGSEYSERAIDFVAELFSDSKNAEILCVSVIDPAAGTELETIIESVEDLTAPGNPAADEAREMLNACKIRFGQHSTSPGVEFSTEVLAGPTARVISERAESWQADMIVLGSHGRGAVKRALFGSVSERVMHHSSCPVLIVR